MINTSFNVRGEPIVCTPEDAYLCFMRTNMDVLVLGNQILLTRTNSPSWSRTSTGVRSTRSTEVRSSRLPHFLPGDRRDPYELD